MSTEVTKTNNALSLTTQKELETTSWGTEGVDSTDVRVPMLLLMQGLSKMVTDEKCQPGDIVHSQTEKTLGGKGKTVSIIPIMTYKTVEFFVEEEKGKWQRKAQEPWHPKYKNQLGFSKSPEGLESKVEAVLNFYVMLKDELDEEDALPCLLKLRRTNTNVGRKLVTYFKQCEMKNIPPATFTWELGSVKQSNDKGTFYTFDASLGEEMSQGDRERYFPKLYMWYKMIASGMANIVVDEPGESDSEATPF